MKEYPVILDKVHYNSEKEFEEAIEQFRIDFKQLSKCFEILLKSNSPFYNNNQDLHFGKSWLFKIKNHGQKFVLRWSSHFHPSHLFQKKKVNERF